MSESKAELICNQVQSDIASGVFNQRTFLSVTDLMERYQAGKVPVRDALKTLCEKGFLISYPRRGYMVNFFSIEDVNKIQGVRRQLERYAVQLAIAKASDEEIMSLREYSNLNAQKGANVQFHIRLAELSGNEYLVEIVRNLVYKIAASRQEEQFLRNGADSENAYSVHERIIDALLARNEETAIKELEEDIRFI